MTQYLLQVLHVNSSALEVYTVIKRHQHTERVTQLSFIWELQAHFLGGLSDQRPTPSVGSNFQNSSISQDLTNLFVLLLCNQKHKVSEENCFRSDRQMVIENISGTFLS